MFATAACTAALLPFVFVVATQAQTRVPDAPSCARCTIRIQRFATLGTVDGPGSLPGSSIIRQDGAGRFWVIHPPDLPLVFDSLGRVVTTSFRKGQGPGEFRGPALPIPLPGDSTLAIEGIPPRATVLGPDLRAARLVQTSLILGDAIPYRWPDRVLVNGEPIGRSRDAQPLALTSFAANPQQITSSFGKQPGEAPRPEGTQVHIARAGNNVWVAELTRYRLTEWSLEGKMLRVLERKPDWFDAEGTDWGGRDKPPRPHVADIDVDDKGLIWVYLSVAAPTWREAWPTNLPPGTREVAADRIRREKQYHTIVEVIDPAAGRVVARSNLNEYLGGTFPNRRAAVYFTDADDIPHYRLVRLFLDGR